VGLVLAAVAAVVSAGVYARGYATKRADEHAVAAAQRELNDAVRAHDLDAIRAALDHWAAVSPSDPTPGRYREMIDRGEAGPDTPELANVLLSHHLREGRLPEAAREAGKVLARYPKHWLARCCVAHHALQVERDPARAEQLLAQLPDPEDPEASVHGGGVLYALRLSDAVGRDATQLRRLVVRRLVPMTRSPAVAGAAPAAKAQLVACYLEPFSDPAALPELADFWASADRLADEAVAGALAAGDVAALIRVAELGPRTRAALAALRDHDPNRLTPERYAAFRKAIDDRTRRAWDGVRAKAPDRPEPYRALAMLAIRDDDAPGAVRHLLDGLAACGDSPALLELLVAVVARVGTDESVRRLSEAVWKAAEAAETDVVKWCLAAELARARGRADAALAACDRARALRPGHPWACATAARLLVRAGKFFDAREALAPVGEHVVLANPNLARLHARILVGSGLWVVRDDEFRKVLTARTKTNPASAAAPAGFLAGVLDAPRDAGRAAWVAGQAELLLASEPDAPLVGRVKAEALFRLAELSAVPNPKGPELPPAWDADRVAAALRAIGQLTPDERADPDVLAATATLLLKGQGNPAAAVRTVSSFLAPDATLTPPQLEILGAALLADDRPADAVRVLQRAAALARPRPPAGTLVALAAAYHKNHQPIDAAAALAAAEDTPERSDREQAELVAAKFMLKREKP
jgi:predicted Zn-dependent protease